MTWTLSTPRVVRQHQPRGQVTAGPTEVEPIYGEVYLPRKFKTAFVVPPHNDVDVFANDLGFIAIIENGELQGFNLSVGGGLGATHGDPETYPRIADVVGFLRPEQVIAVAEAVLTTQRDFGNRAVRKLARLKYTIDSRGLDWFVAEITRRLGYRTGTRPAVRVHDHRRSLRLDRGVRRPLAPDAAHRGRAHPRHRSGPAPDRTARDCEGPSR